MGLELTSVVKHMELATRLLEGGAEHGPCAGTADIPTVSQTANSAAALVSCRNHQAQRDTLSPPLLTAAEMRQDQPELTCSVLRLWMYFLSVPTSQELTAVLLAWNLPPNWLWWECRGGAVAHIAQICLLFKKNRPRCSVAGPCL